MTFFFISRTLYIGPNFFLNSYKNCEFDPYFPYRLFTITPKFDLLFDSQNVIYLTYTFYFHFAKKRKFDIYFHIIYLAYTLLSTKKSIFDLHFLCWLFMKKKHDLKNRIKKILFHLHFLYHLFTKTTSLINFSFRLSQNAIRPTYFTSILTKDMHLTYSFCCCSCFCCSYQLSSNTSCLTDTFHFNQYKHSIFDLIGIL